jgi:GGDEF domain-containing protein
VFRDSNAVATSPDSGDVSMDVNAVAGAIKAEIFGTEAPAPDEAAQPELEATLTDEAGEISDEYMHMRERSAQLWAEVLPGLSRGEYEALASETQGADPRAASESELQVIRERVQKKRALDTGVMRGLREQGIADASRGLQQATTGELAMPPVSPEIAREKRSDEAGIRPEKISERDDKTPLEAKQAEDLVTPEVLPTAEVQRKPFTAQAEIAKTEYQEKAKGLGLTEKQIKELEPQEALDVVTGLQKAENREPTMKRAIEHVSETGEQGHYIEADITNLGGLNDKLGHTGANKVYNKFATIFAEEMDNIGADATKFRHGGDEISAIVVNASKEQIDAALTKARDRIATYTKDEGLSEIVHPKHRRNKEMRGTGLIFGTSEITENKEAGDIFSEADISVEETKRERADVHRKQIETVGVTGVEGQARRTDEGARAEEARIAEQVAEKVAAKKPARLEPVSRRKEIEAQERQQAEQVAPQAEPGVVEPAEAATRIEAKPKLEPVRKKKEEAELSPTEKLLSKFYSPKEIAGFKQETSKLNESETLEFYEKKYDEGKQQAEEPKKLKPVSKKKSEPKVKVEPKVEIKPTVKTDVEALIDIWDQYYDTGELTHMDLVDEVEEFVADSEGNDDTAALQKAVSEYRKEQADDLELGGRGDMDSAEDNFNNVLLGVIEVKPVEPKPAVPATPAEPQDPYRAMYGKEISYEVELEDTGETYTVTVDAGVIMKELDAREEALRKLRDCI